MAVAGHYWAIVALVFIVCSLLSVLLRRPLLGSLLAYLQRAERGRRTSALSMPPRSPSPGKKAAALPPIQSPVDYKDVFPPSSRHGLACTTVFLHEGKLKGRQVSKTQFRKSVIPFEADYRCCGPSTYTPTGISIEEVKALGDFPDYAELSGVPLPNEYKGFKLDQAMPRPYRPFRWMYHQTMCM